jgi:multiple sugar transport system ATP-binding protein
MADVVFEGVIKRFGDVTAVADLDLAIADGEFMTLLGPSGCGKTTTLNLIAGLEYPDKGKITIGGVDVSTRQPGERNVAMAFQNYALYPHKTVYENLAFPLKARVRNFHKDQINAKVLEIARLLDIESLLQRMPRELSGGQQQRVSIGRCLVRQPNVFLLDEPLSNLDARLRLKMRAELKKLHHITGGTFVYVTHDQAEAMTLSTRIALFKTGSLQQVGTPSELYNTPVNAFVAGFLGERDLNIISTELRMESGALWLRGPGMAVPAPAFAIPDTPGSGTAQFQLGVRPEDITITTDATEACGHGEVTLVEPMGSHRFVHLDIPDGGPELVCRIDNDIEACPGERLSFKFTKSFLFDTIDGKTVGSI